MDQRQTEDLQVHIKIERKNIYVYTQLLFHINALILTNLSNAIIKIIAYENRFLYTATYCHASFAFSPS